MVKFLNMSNGCRTNFRYSSNDVICMFKSVDRNIILPLVRSPISGAYLRGGGGGRLSGSNLLPRNYPIYSWKKK